MNEADAGDYRCTATNNLGTAYHIIMVTVKGMQSSSCFTVEEFSFIATSELGFNVSSAVFFKFENKSIEVWTPGLVETFMLALVTWCFLASTKMTEQNNALKATTAADLSVNSHRN